MPFVGDKNTLVRYKFPCEAVIEQATFEIKKPDGTTLTLDGTVVPSTETRYKFYIDCVVPEFDQQGIWCIVLKVRTDSWEGTVSPVQQILVQGICE